jgi:hypothetical protein
MFTYHVLVSFRAHSALYTELWSRVERNAVISGIVLLGALAFCLPAHIVIGVFFPGLILAATLSKIFLAVILASLAWNIYATAWEVKMAAKYKEYRAVEKHHGSIFPHHQSVKDYFIWLVTLLRNKGLVSVDEYSSWIKALNEVPGARFVRPQGERAREILQLSMQSLGIKKPAAEIMSRLSGLTSDIHAAGERFYHTAESSFRPGTFNSPHLKTDDHRHIESRDICLLGYFARLNRPV